MAQKVAQYINPVLKVLKELDGSARPREVYDRVAEDLALPESIINQTRKDGRPVFQNEIAWAKQYLVESGYVDNSRRGVWRLTDKGRNSTTLSDAEVERLLHGVQRRIRERSSDIDEIEDQLAPANENVPIEEDREQKSYQQQLLELLASLPPSGFERLCRRLLLEHDFQEVTVTGRSGDGGIDGIGVLKVNPFVTFKVLFQCKRWKGTVGPAPVREFRGAMLGRADKGLILTTGAFSAEAHREAVRDGVPPIELIDGEELIELFEQLELGLTPRTTYDVDFGFFKEFQE